MAKRLDTIRDKRTGSEASWHGTAFVIEALLLLVFLAFALAVFMQLFSEARQRGVEEKALTQAVILAANDAEAFAAAPQTEATTNVFDSDEGGERATFTVVRDVSPERTGAGTLYQAHIVVEREGVVVYELETSRYVSDGANAANSAPSVPDATADLGTETASEGQGGDAA